MIPAKTKEKRLILSGFTLVEILIVIGIIVVLLTITLIAINPLENFNKVSDIKAMTIATDFAKGF
jgi:prepilin-type N-terminal cleavage/methylation domain-containing protein